MLLLFCKMDIRCAGASQVLKMVVLVVTMSVVLWQMVPIKEMTDVLKVIKETAYLKPKQWVRLKRGIFRDDLAQV